MKDFRVLIISISIAISSLASILLYFLNVDVSIWMGAAVIFFASLIVNWFVFKFLIVSELGNIESTVQQMNTKTVFDFSKELTYKFKRTRDLDKSIKKISGEMNDEIQEFKRMAAFRKEFIANISHELKTPLFAAQGFVHTLIDGAVRDKSVRNRFLKKAAKSLDSLDILVQDLLTLSQIEIGDIRMHFEYFDLGKMSKEIFDQLEVNAEKKGVQLKLTTEKGPVLVFADYKRIHQVMTNLIQNAIKYNKEDGWVNVQLKEEGNLLKISVADSGEGIAKQHLDRIFERFYRVDKSRTRSKGGTGLGLSIVKHILEGHEATIFVKSIQGEGSNFYFRLSTAKDQDELTD